MGEPTVRQTLNRLRWHPEGSREAVTIGYLVRDEIGEHVAETAFTAVVGILPAGVTLSGGTFIPYHRLRFVRQGGAPLWSARERRDDDEG